VRPAAGSSRAADDFSLAVAFSAELSWFVDSTFVQLRGKFC